MATRVREHVDRKASIVDALYQAIHEHGVSVPSFDQIANVAGTSRQLVRHYFPDPEELVLALCDRLEANYRECLAMGVNGEGKSHRLTLILDFFFDSDEEAKVRKPDDDVVYDAVLAYAAGNEAVRRCLCDQYTQLQVTVAQELQISYPELTYESCNELSYLMATNMYGHWKMVGSLGFNNRQNYNRIARSAVDRLIECYRRDARENTGR